MEGLSHIRHSYFCPPTSLSPHSLPHFLTPSLPPSLTPFLTSSLPLLTPSSSLTSSLTLPPSLLPHSEATISRMLMNSFVTSWTSCTQSCREGPTQLEVIAISGMALLCRDCLEAGFRVMWVYCHIAGLVCAHRVTLFAHNIDIHELCMCNTVL